MLTVKDLEVGKTYTILSGNASDVDITINNPFTVHDVDEWLVYSKDSKYEGEDPYDWDKQGWCILGIETDKDMTFAEVK
jgi:hypothetical protein